MDMPSVPVMIRGDARQIGQAVTNVVKNALEAIEAKLGPLRGPGHENAGHGRIEVKVDVTEAGAVVSITDNGVGLPQDRGRLTEPYVTSRAKGTGLGLAIVKKVLEDHGGKLLLDDAPTASDGSRGASVSLEFPAALLVRASAAQLVAG
jgi:two-component system nitrogen regulation sensor histidine kinase NtrY